MDHPIAGRRVSRIMGHVTSLDEELSSPNSHLLPMNCSSTLNSFVPRRDNTLFFARQGSASQAYFMQQASIKQNSNRSNCPSKNVNSCYQYSEKPSFSRQAQTSCNLPTLKDGNCAKENSAPISTEAPKFARPYTETIDKSQFCSNRTNQVSLCKDMEWSPRIDVAESGNGYVVTVELPGVSIMDIRVEIDDQKLIVTGKRARQQLGVANGTDNQTVKYHRREILQGPYRVFWPLPNNVNKDAVSADFINGFLKINLPKL
ncbi:uncharacterized protein A4U43_C01F14010 [Asparagus officinalis]|uniref:SHSP domain-containing protein n=1 Tax=Asparagus officinalis TaxID=4686 RepID=A0A5P1FPS4_ASPOF|nr:uncharacterized protein LOC109842205 [Asparagus officinalis]ONK80112.1 uncharacterized protein A4U43_C01F14010 [Asparagus officinalis]